MPSFEPHLYPSKPARVEPPVERFAKQVPANYKRDNWTVSTSRISRAETSRRRRKMPVGI